jgi:hypothetical protein
MKPLIMQFNENITRHKKERTLEIKACSHFNLKDALRRLAGWQEECATGVAVHKYQLFHHPPAERVERGSFLPSPTPGIWRVHPT